MENVKIQTYDLTENLEEFNEFIGDLAEEEKNDPAIVVGLRRVLESARHDAECIDDPRWGLIIEALELLLKPVTTNNIVDFLTVASQFEDLLNEPCENETDEE